VIGAVPGLQPGRLIAVADLIGQLHATATPTAVLGGRGSPASWLFPGQVPGRHLSVNGLVRQLNTHGIQARIGRSAALINLATDLPAAVLADLLGLHINTAVRWVKRARRDWASYLAARAEAPCTGQARNMAEAGGWPGSPPPAGLSPVQPFRTSPSW